MSGEITEADICREHADGITHVFPLPYPDSEDRRERLLSCALSDEQVVSYTAQAARGRMQLVDAS